MSKKEKEIDQEFIEEPTEKKDWRPKINYQWIVKNLPFLLFLSLLAIIYIANGHFSVKNIREINKLDKEVKELHWEYLDAKSRLMLKSKMSEVSQGVSPMGLKVPETTPLELNENNKEK